MQSLQMDSFLVLATVVDVKDNIVGYLVVGTDGQSTRMLSLEQVQFAGSNAHYLNAEFSTQYKILNGTNGASLVSYPPINSDYVVTKGKAGIIVMCTVLDQATKKPMGVVAFNSIGTRFVVTYKKLNELSNNFKCCNYEMKVDSQYGLMAVKKDGSYFDTIEMTKPTKVDKNIKDLKSDVNSIEQSTSRDMPVIKVTDFSNISSGEVANTAQEKLVKTMLNMQKLTPYYYTVFQAIKRLPAPGLVTLGVTEDTLYYDMAFVAQMRVSELTFVLIHEIMHLAMQHSLRFGGRKNHTLWNIATDLYINSIICNDFNVRFGGDEVNIGSSAKPVCIKTPEFGVYAETVGAKIDLAIDTPESIYADLLRENSDQQSGGMNMPYFGNKSPQNQSQQQQGGQEAGQAMQEGMKKVKQGAKSAQDNINSTSDSNAQSKAKNAKKEISQGMKDIKDGMKNSDLSQIQQGMKKVEQGVSDMKDAQNQSGQSNSTEGQKAEHQMDSGLKQMKAAVDAVQNGTPQASQGQGQPSQNGQGQGQNQGQSQDQNGQGQGQGSGNGSGQGSGGAGEGMEQKSDDPFGGKGNDFNSSSNQGSSESVDDFNDNQDGSGGYSSMREVNVVYNGKKLKGSIMTDVLSSNASRKKEDIQQKVDNSRRALQKINTKIELEEKEKGHSLAKNAGSGAGLTQRYIEVGLSAGVDWKVLLRNMCKDKPKKTFTLAQPNQDYMNMGMTLADRRPIGKPTHVSHVKFAIDVSGSVSQRELQIMLSEINNIFTQFKVDGELIYWSTEIGDAGQFSNLKDMLKVKPNSTGGTDVKCVFDYLAGKTKVHGKFEDDKKRDIKAVFIITDGYFSNNYEEYTHMFGKKVVWLITGAKGNPITFNPPFGRVIGLNVEF